MFNGMKMTNSSDGQVDPGRLRVIMLLPLGWLIFVALVPDFFMRVFGHSIPWARVAASGVGILLVCVFTAYLLAKVRRERGLVLLTLTGTAFLLVSESFRIVQSLRPLNSFAARDWMAIQPSSTMSGVALNPATTGFSFASLV